MSGFIDINVIYNGAPMLRSSDNLTINEPFYVAKSSGSVLSPVWLSQESYDDVMSIIQAGYRSTIPSLEYSTSSPGWSFAYDQDYNYYGTVYKIGVVQYSPPSAEDDASDVPSTTGSKNLLLIAGGLVAAVLLLK